MHVLHLLPDFAIGGGQQVVLTLVSYRSPGLMVTVAGIGGDSTLEAEFRSVGADTRVFDLENNGWLSVIRGVWKLIATTGIDLVHVHVGRDRRIGQLVALATRTPVISHLHGVHDHLSMGSISGPAWRAGVLRLRRWVNRKVEELTVRRYIAVSEGVVALHRGKRHVPIETIPNGVDVNHFRPNDTAGSAVRSRLGIPEAAPVLLNIGRMVQGKGQIELVAAFVDCPGFLVLVGDGPERERIEARIRELGLSKRVSILPATRDLVPIYSAADVFIHASRSEGFGLVLAEAMSCGVPAVALRIPATEQIIAHGVDGVLVDRLADLPAVIKGLSNGQLKRLGHKARDRVKADFSAAQMTARVESVYRDVIGRDEPNSAA